MLYVTCSDDFVRYHKDYCALLSCDDISLVQLWVLFQFVGCPKIGPFGESHYGPFLLYLMRASEPLASLARPDISFAVLYLGQLLDFAFLHKKYMNWVEEEIY